MQTIKGRDQHQVTKCSSFRARSGWKCFKGFKTECEKEGKEKAQKRKAGQHRIILQLIYSKEDLESDDWCNWGIDDSMVWDNQQIPHVVCLHYQLLMGKCTIHFEPYTNFHQKL